jgi:hypothetical protein
VPATYAAADQSCAHRINGNEYAKCQLRKRGIAFEALDNGILSCEDPKALQRICDGLAQLGVIRKVGTELLQPRVLAVAEANLDVRIVRLQDHQRHRELQNEFQVRLRCLE